MFSQFEGAEIVAEKFNVTREEMEELAVSSHKRAYEATKEGRFKNEIIPVKGFDKKANAEVVHDVDEGIRWPTEAAKLGADLNKLNVNGGAMALGHPLGATGTKIMTTLLNELERRNLRYGIQAICEGGGTANATIIERIPQSKM